MRFFLTVSVGFGTRSTDRNLTTTIIDSDTSCLVLSFKLLEKREDGDEDTIDGFGGTYQQAGVKRVVQLSSIGAHREEGNGILGVYHELERSLNELPSDVTIGFMLPVGFYYNLFGFIQTIKTQGVIATNYGGDNKKPWVSPIDIAAAVAEELVTPFQGRRVRYVASDEVSCNELATILGAAIGKPDLKWVVIPDEQLLNGMIAAGMNQKIAAGLVEMNAATHTGKLYEDYNRHKPTLGKVKPTDFAKEFAAAYNQKC